MATPTKAQLRTFINDPTYTTWNSHTARLYDMKREGLPGEIDYYASLVKGTCRGTEIGAGTGYLSVHFATAGIKQLTLVEPMRGNLELLRMRTRPFQEHNGVNIEIVEAFYQDYTGTPQDVILFPYDTLPMLHEPAQRQKLFDAVSRNLVQGGLFALHVSTPAWNRAFIEALKEPKVFEVPGLFDLPPFTATYEVLPFDDAMYVKRITHTEGDETKDVIYSAVAILDPEEVVAMAVQSGLVLQQQYSDFGNTPIQNLSEAAEDIVLEFRKK